MELSELKNFDYFIAAIIIFSSYLGCKKGFIESFLDFMAWAGSAIIVLDSYTFTFELLNEYIPSKFICGLVASIGLYIILVIAISMLGLKIIKLTSKFAGSTVDKFIGTSFGALRGFLIGTAVFWSLYMSLYAMNDKQFPEWFNNAKSYKVLKMSSDALFDALTSEEQRKNMLNSIAKKSDSLERELKDKIGNKNTEIKKVTTSSEYFQE